MYINILKPKRMNKQFIYPTEIISNIIFVYKTKMLWIVISFKGNNNIIETNIENIKSACFGLDFILFSLLDRVVI